MESSLLVEGEKLESTSPRILSRQAVRTAGQFFYTDLISLSHRLRSRWMAPMSIRTQKRPLIERYGGQPQSTWQKLLALHGLIGCNTHGYGLTRGTTR